MVCCLAGYVAGAVGRYSAGERFSVYLGSVSVPALCSLSLSNLVWFSRSSLWTEVREDG